MLTEREKTILKMIVENYIKEARPVPSSLICKHLNCSSATIRNEMVILEEAGYLEKAHISSGRIPSDKGYHYYVNNLMDANKITGSDMLKLQKIFTTNALSLSDSIKKSIEIISDITNYTVVKLGTAAHTNRLKEVRSVPLDKDRVIVLVITDSGYVEHQEIYLPNINLEDIKKTIEIINSMIVGTYIDEINQKLEFEVKPIISKIVEQHELIYESFYKVFQKITSPNVVVAGKENIARLPEFKSKTDKVYEILDKLDERKLINKVIADDSNISVYIGKENDIDQEVTVIRTSYKTQNEQGSIAIIGPKRMDYERIMNILDILKKHIEEGNKKNG